MKSGVEIKQLTKVFKNNRAFEDVSFPITKGKVKAILGSNGAGKTATKLMLGLLNPTEGEVLLFGSHPK